MIRVSHYNVSRPTMETRNRAASQSGQSRNTDTLLARSEIAITNGGWSDHPN